MPIKLVVFQDGDSKREVVLTEEYLLRPVS